MSTIVFMVLGSLAGVFVGVGMACGWWLGLAAVCATYALMPQIREP